MIVSSRGRYALRILVDLALHQQEGYVPMKEMAKRKDISQKYMESIMPVLVKGGLVAGVTGKGGGYRLTRAPASITVGEVLRLTEGDLAPVSCLSSKGEPCGRTAACPTFKMWEDFDKLTNDYFDAIPLSRLLGRE